MEIKVRCHKEGNDWIIEDPGQALVTEYDVIWTFEGLEPGIVPLLGFRHLLGFDTNPPFGPFDRARFTASSIHAGFRDFPKDREHSCSLALVKWGEERSTILAHRTHTLRIQAPEKLVIKVYWRHGDAEPSVDPGHLSVGALAQVEWQFDVPDDVFTTLDFQTCEPKDPSQPRPLGPFAELHGSKVDGQYSLTGWTDGYKACYHYAVSIYDRQTGKLLINPDPQLDNNGIPPG